MWAYNGQVPGPDAAHPARRDRARAVHEPAAAGDDDPLARRARAQRDGRRTERHPAAGQPGGTFVYEFTPKDAGTFWFHPHVRSSEQVERGLYGVLVVEDAQPPPYTRDVVWVLDDWLLDATGQIAPQFNTRHDLAMDGRWGNAITVNGRTNTVLDVRPGERIRLRLLNSANGRVFVPDFGELDAKIIAVDGLYLRAPIPARGFELAPGNRLDLDVTFDRSSRRAARDLGPLLRAAPEQARDDRGRRRRSSRHRASRRPRTRTSRAGPTRSTSPVAPRRSSSTRRRAARSASQWTIDGMAMDRSTTTTMPPPSTLDARPDRAPALRQRVGPHPPDPHARDVLQAARAQRHAASTSRSFATPCSCIRARRSTSGIVPIDAGTWMMHCHILEHAEAGMMTTIAVREN